MNRERPKTIVFPDDRKTRVTFERYLEGLRQLLPPTVRHVETIGLYVEYLLLQYLLDEGSMVNTSSFLEMLAEAQPPLHTFLEKNPYILDVVCVDLKTKIDKSKAGHA